MHDKAVSPWFRMKVLMRFCTSAFFVLVATLLSNCASAQTLNVQLVAEDPTKLAQQARRDADLHVSDRIRLEITGSATWIEAIDQHRDLIAAETLAVELLATLPEASGEGDEPQISVAKQSVT